MSQCAIFEKKKKSPKYFKVFEKKTMVLIFDKKWILEGYFIKLLSKKGVNKKNHILLEQKFHWNNTTNFPSPLQGQPLFFLEKPWWRPNLGGVLF